VKTSASSTATGAAAPAAADARTRDRVAQTLLEEGSATAATLGDRLGLTPAAVRRHLDAMIDGGVVEEVPERRVRGASRGRGRPARRFALTARGRAAFPQAYDELATEALRFLADHAGDAAVAEFAESRVAALEARYSAAVAAAPTPKDRAKALADALSADGYAASTTDAGQGLQLCQHHCPVQHAAQQFPQLCDAETAVFGRLLGTHVQRLATLAHGDGVCTTHVPAAQQAPPDADRPRRATGPMSTNVSGRTTA
jgi:predicted ArsR family transcriptional regulator